MSLKVLFQMLYSFIIYKFNLTFNFSDIKMAGEDYRVPPGSEPPMYRPPPSALQLRDR